MYICARKKWFLDLNKYMCLMRPSSVVITIALECDLRSNLIVEDFWLEASSQKYTTMHLM